MVLSFKNNDIYYYDYKLFDGKLSWFLVPFFVFIYINEDYIKYFSYPSILVAFIGTIDTYLAYLKYEYTAFFTIGAILHLILLYPLININKYLKPDLINLILGIVGLLIIKYLPYWPYFVTRDQSIMLSIISYFLTFLIYYLNNLN
tara:strand:+ start:168 stop:605 length:438 start_codon:yes stop_codon:yes gene_type:complete